MDDQAAVEAFGNRHVHFLRPVRQIGGCPGRDGDDTVGSRSWPRSGHAVRGLRQMDEATVCGQLQGHDHVQDGERVRADVVQYVTEDGGHQQQGQPLAPQLFLHGDLEPGRLADTIVLGPVLTGIIVSPSAAVQRTATQVRAAPAIGFRSGRGEDEDVLVLQVVLGKESFNPRVPAEETHVCQGVTLLTWSDHPIGGNSWSADVTPDWSLRL